jgi:anti-sigma B factor antagonist
VAVQGTRTSLATPPCVLALLLRAFIRYILVSSRRAVVGLQIHTTRIEPGIVIVLLSGTVTRCAEPSWNELFIHDLLEQGERKLILDLTGIERMDSSGVQMMYACYSAAQNVGGELRFVGANSRVARLFEMTRLDLVLPFYSTIDAALRDFLLRNKVEGSQ